MSGRSVNLTTLFLGRLRPPKRLTSTSHILSPVTDNCPFLKKLKVKRKYVARPGIEPRTPDLRVRCPTDCATRSGTALKLSVIDYYCGWAGTSHNLLDSTSCPYLLHCWVRYPVWQHTFVSPSAFSRRAVVSYWRKYVHEVLVNRLGGLSLPRKSVVRLTDRPDMTLDVYRGRKTTKQQQPSALVRNILSALRFPNPSMNQRRKKNH